MLADRRTA